MSVPESLSTTPLFRIFSETLCICEHWGAAKPNPKFFLNYRSSLQNNLSVQETLDELAWKITTYQEQPHESDELTSSIQEQHQRLLSWAEMYDSASQEEKRMVASYIIKAVTLTRDYGIQVEFNISEAQYLSGMEMG